MSRVFYSELARQDLKEILKHIKQDRPLAARKFVGRIRTKCRLLGTTPGLGERRQDLGSGDLRTTFVGNYVIVYREVDDGVEIVRVVHGAREWEKLFR